MQDFVSLVQELKAAHGEPLYGMDLGGQLYIFRLLGPDEYRLLIESGASGPEVICHCAVVWPAVADWEQHTAADADKLAEQILELSGFGSRTAPYRMLKVFREEMNSFTAQAAATVAAAFPSQDLFAIERWPYEKLLYYLARAEWILQNVHGRPVSIQVEEPDGTPPDPQIQAQTLRQQGVDPMLALHVPPRRDANWVGQPFIHGSQRWRVGNAESS